MLEEAVGKFMLLRFPKTNQNCSTVGGARNHRDILLSACSRTSAEDMVWGPWLKVYFMVVSSAQEGDPLQQTSENVLLWLPLGNESTKNWRKKYK